METAIGEIRIKKYPAYKDSGVAWLGEIPSHWGTTRLKNIIRAKITDGPHVTPVFINKGIPFLSVDGIQNGELVFENCRYISSNDHLKYKKKCRIEKFDILMGKAASIGKIAQSKVDFEYSIWSPLALIKPTLEKVNATYLEYYLKSTFSQYQIEILCTSNTQKNISMDDIPKILSTLPPLAEQTAIAAFLNHKTAFLDQAINIKQNQIELLNERRQILIHKAVTRGLNPNVKLIDSKEAWLGEIPENWEYIKVKNIFKLIIDPAPINNDYELLSVYTDIGVKPRAELEERGNKASSTDGYWLVKKGDIIINKLLAWMGAIGISDYDGVTSPAYDILRARIPINGYYYHNLFRMPSCKSELKKHSRGIMDMRLRLYFDKFGDVRIPYPPIDEQNSIVEYLTGISNKIATAISLKEQEIEKLKEYKATLINSAVTGKIKVYNDAK